MLGVGNGTVRAGTLGVKQSGQRAMVGKEGRGYTGKGREWGMWVAS